MVTNFDWGVALVVDLHLLPTGDLLLATGDVFVERHVEFFQQLRLVALDKVGRVLREMLRRLSDEIAKPREHLISHSVPIRDSPLFRNISNQRIEVLPVSLIPHDGLKIPIPPTFRTTFVEGIPISFLALMDEMYQVTRIQPVDMFPHTHHVENVVLLVKREK